MSDDASSATSPMPRDPAAEAWCRPPDFGALNRYGWAWCADETVDANYLDLAYLVARNSTCKDGHMGCALVGGLPPGGGGGGGGGPGGACSAAQQGELLLCTINTPLFGAHRSDCHAEANAVAECASRGVATRGLSCYVTRAPCLACYKLLASAGIRRIVAPQSLDSADCAASARALGIECTAVRDSDARAARREQLGHSHEDMARVRALREERKRLRKERTFGKKAIRGGGGGGDGGGTSGGGSGDAAVAPPAAAAQAEAVKEVHVDREESRLGNEFRE